MGRSMTRLAPTAPGAAVNALCCRVLACSGRSNPACALPPFT